MTTWGWSTCGPPPPWAGPPGAGGPPPGSGPRRPAPRGGLRLRLHPPGVDRRRPAGPGRLFPARPWPEELEPASLSHLERALLARVRSLPQAGGPSSRLRCGGGASRPARPGGKQGPVCGGISHPVQDQAVLPRPPAPSPAVGLPGPDRRRPPGCPALPPGSGLHPTGGRSSCGP